MNKNKFKILAILFINVLAESNAITIDVKDYGAEVNDDIDDYFAIQQAIKALDQTKSGTLIFHKGVYDIKQHKIDNNKAVQKTVSPIYESKHHNNLKLKRKLKIVYLNKFEENTKRKIASQISNFTFTNYNDLTIKGNGANNNLDYKWQWNGTIYLMGGKSSEIRFNYFKDISNENIIGHGMNVHDNIFDGLNGSALHTSLADTTLSLNGLAAFLNNTVIDVNRIDKDLNGHSEGAVTFSWGAGNLTVKDNLFYSYSANYGVLGAFGVSSENTDENLIVFNNMAYNFEYIIRLYPRSGSEMNVSIANNTFSNCGENDFTHLYIDTSVKFGCNTELGNTEIILDDLNSACH